ncbi:uncharacterized protein LOC143912277 [Arctopsyche grandis]|uniref:uncharacterized protein LOC143912277 n=1 Tax=Arctopsyche grandis TaxID=121162 RepID=UPI00406D75F7
MDWRRVIFSDESKFNLFGSDGIHYVRRRSGERLSDKCIQPTVKHPAGTFSETAIKECSLLESGRPVPINPIGVLKPFLDQDGLIRVGGRLSHAGLRFEKTHPVLVPSISHLAELLIRATHEQLLHAGPQAVSAQLRDRYWLPGGKGAVARVIRRCVICAKAHPRPPFPLMGDLPTVRVTPARPFYSCGVDYAGPITIKERAHKNRTFLKAYICVFVCLATKAVHLEVVQSLTSNAFIDALKRFVSRRGLVAEVWSDNGTNFVGGERALRQLVSSKQFKNAAMNFSTAHHIKWRFIPPRSPHFGGLWEAAVKTMKRHLTRIAGNVSLTYEALNTLVIQIETVMNSRPLTPMSSDPGDLIPLTPGHFLVGGPLLAFPQENLADISANRLSRYRQLQQMLQHFWRRWSREYITLQQRHRRGAKEAPNLQPGDLVVVAEDSLPPLAWPMGRVTQVHPGHDGVVRIVTLRTQKGVIKRASRRVARLPIDQQTQPAD